MCGPVGAPDAIHSLADRGYHLAVNRSVDRRQGGPLAVGDVVHLDRRQHARRFLATDGDDPAVDERGAVAPARSRHVRELVPVSGYRVEPLERRRVLVGRSDSARPPCTRRRRPTPQRGVHAGSAGRRPASRTARRTPRSAATSLLFVLPADDDELVADDRCRRRRAGMLEGRKLFPLAVAECEDLVRRVREVVAGATDDHHFTAIGCRRSRDAGESAAEAAFLPRSCSGVVALHRLQASRRGAYRRRSRSRRRAPSTPSSTSRSARPVGSAIPMPVAVCARASFSASADDVT